MARALRETRAGQRPPPLMLALCDAASSRAANRLASDGVFDHYLPHFPMSSTRPAGDRASASACALAGAATESSAPIRQRQALGGERAAAPVAGRSSAMVEDDEFTARSWSR